ncbi:MAG TPA: hypothetical protein VFV63_17695, partial [Ilumatobacteraceae bacterium]|nr:hypothetical protein [Ilumatobacteraceae bacterium]
GPALNNADAIKARYELTDDTYADLLDFAVQLAFGGYSARTLLPQMRTSLAALRKQESQAARWSFEIQSVSGEPGTRRTNYRPQMTLVSEENGQAIPMIAMLGEAVGSTDANQHWILFDVTSDKTQRRYHGYSTQGGQAGTIEAIRNAFVDFRENAEYGRGTIAIRLPANLHEDVGFTVPIESTMRAAPGATARWMQRLQDLALAAGIAALVVATLVTGGAAAAMVLGIVGGVAGAAVAIHRMSNRAEGDRLRLDYDTFVDILAIVGAVAAIAGPLATTVAAVGRTTVLAAREAGDVARVMRAASWVQRAEMTSRGLHIFGIVQGVGQIVIQVPYEIIRQFDEIDKEEANNPNGASPGQRRARRAMVLLNGFQSGMINVISLGQSLLEPTPRVTSDAEIYSHAAIAAGRAPVDTPPAVGTGGDGPPTPSPDAPPPTRPDTPDTPTTGQPPPGREPADQPRRIPVEPPTGVDRPGPGDDTAPTVPTRPAEDVPPPVPTRPPDDGPPPVDRRPDDDGGPARPGIPAPATPPPPSGPIGRALNATQLVARVRGIVTADRAEPPPAGRIRIVDGATLASQTGHPVGTLAVDDPASGQLVVNRELLHGTAGLPERLQALVEARAHRTGRQGLGDPVAGALMRRVVADVFGPGSGFPVGADSPIGQRLLDLLQATVGIRPLLDALFHGSIGSVRDALRERFGHTRSEAILDAARTGSIAELTRLTTPERGALAESYGRPFADGVADLLNDHGDRPGADRPAKALARELAELAGVQALRDAYFAGDVAALDRAIDARIGSAARRTLGEQIAAGDIAGARRTLADAAAGRAPVATVPAQAAEPAARFVDSLTGPPEGSRWPATELIQTLADFRSLRRLVDNGAVGGSDVVAAARDRIQAARMAIVDSALDVVKRGVEARIPGVRLRFQDLGTPGFGSDRDVTLVAESANPDAPVPVPDLVRASSEAVRDAYDQLRTRGYEADAA